MRDSTKLNRKGLKVTTPRLTILKIFEEHPQRHLTADDVVVMLRQRHSDLGLPTVYRVLARLTEAGILERNMFDWERSRASYELASAGPHGHLVCRQCGAIEEFDDSMIAARQSEVASERAFDMEARAQILFGRCVNCRSVVRPAHEAG
jgi:Fur family transcriptional regulator, ferric uptake regulator